jgi:lysophospholipase L1-like esterase
MERGRSVAEMKRGIVALGDSITRGKGGAPALGVHPQSWVQWVAETLEMPLTNLARDGATAADVLRDQVPRLSGPYDIATLFVGANDARRELDPTSFAHDLTLILTALRQAADRVLVLTIPEDLGRPRAGQDVKTANAVLRAQDAEICALDDLRGYRVMLPDAVHPTSPGMVAIADRALAALGFEPRVVVERRGWPRYVAWWGWQAIRDHRRRWLER